MRKILLVFAGVLIVVVVGVIIAISLVDISEYKDQALAQVESATGREVSIDGELDLSISLNPAIVAEGIRFANADWGSRADMVTIKRIEVQVGLLPLLGGVVEVQRFILIEPDVLLEKNADGKGNWEIGPATTVAQEKDTGGSEVTPVDINKILIQKLNLVYKDAKEEKQFTIDTLRLDSVDAGKLDIELTAALDQTPINISGQIGDLEWLFGEKDYPLDIKASIGALSGNVDGVVNEPMQGKGLKLVAGLRVSKLSDLNKLTGMVLPAVGPLSFSVNISDPDDTYKLEDIELLLDQTNITGEVTANTGGEVPYANVKLRSSLLDLVPFQSGPAAEEQKVERYLTNEKLPLDGLQAANVDVSLRAARVSTRQGDLTNLDMRLALKDGKLAISPVSVELANGTLAGDVIVDATQDIAKVDVNLTGNEIQLGLLQPLSEKLSGGATKAVLRFRGSGNSSQAIAGGANGKLLVQVGAAEMKSEKKREDGFLAGLGKIINPFDSGENAKLSCAVINFTLRDGIATADRGIGVETDQLTVSGGGKISLKTEKLDLGFEPHAKGAIAGTITNLASGIEVGGTLAEPKMKVDAAKVVGGAVKSLATGAGSLLGGVLGGGTDTGPDTQPCRTALSGKTASSKNKQTEAKTTTKEETKKESLLSAPKKLLKGIFDR